MPRPKTVRTEIKRLRGLLESAGSYDRCFDDVISHLARLYVEIDELRAWYEDDTKNFEMSVMITRTAKDGSPTASLHPALAEINKIITQCLPLEIQLGLTPAARRKLLSSAPDTAQTFAGKLRLLEAE